MARITKRGLDYFPTDVGFLQSRVMRRLNRKHGPAAVSGMMALLSVIYGDLGYYMEWNEDICFDLSEMANIETGKLQEIIMDSLRMEFFSMEQFKANGILTSQEIQKQYLTCTQKRKAVVIEEKFSLICSAEGINSPQNLFSGEEMGECGTETQQRKEKESKEKKTSSPLRGRGCLKINLRWPFFCFLFILLCFSLLFPIRSFS